MQLHLPNPIYSASGLHSARILEDSYYGGNRLTTFEVMFPRIVLAEFNTHRWFSRNSASSRAIPVKKMIEMVLKKGYTPWHWGKNQKGMQADEEVDHSVKLLASYQWEGARDHAVGAVRDLEYLGIHKQITNRLLEPFMLHKVIVTATHYSNFFNLRCHEAAHPDIREVALLMRDLYDEEEPTYLSPGEYHLPLVSLEERETNSAESLLKVSIGRCARVSYLTHDGKRDMSADIQLANRLLESGHMSPFEHVARPATLKDVPNGMIKVSEAQSTDGFSLRPSDVWFGNFKGFVQYRKTIANEDDMLGAM